MTLIFQQLINGISLGGMYALIALGYTMVYGIVELINFAHGDVYTLGSFFALAILGLFSVAGVVHGPMIIVVLGSVLVGSMLLCGVTGVLIERVAYRRLRNAPRLAPLITAIGVSFILENLMQIWHGPSPIPFPEIVPAQSIAFDGVTIALKQAIVIGAAVLLMLILQFFVKNTNLGRAMRATAQDRDAATLMGIDVNATIALTFFLSGLLAGAAGVASGMYYGTTWFFNGFSAGLKAFTAAVLGGIGNIGGAMLGGFLIGIIEAFSTQILSDQWSNVVVFAILIIVLIFRPTGLLGQSLPEKI